MNLNELEQLNDLRLKGAITDAEFEVQKARLLAEPSGELPLGIASNNYCAIMHFAQLLPGAGWLTALILWIAGKETSEKVNRQGAYILNFILSLFVYGIVAIPFIFIVIGIFFYIFLGIIALLFPLIGAIKALSGESWRYPFSIRFIR